MADRDRIARLVRIGLWLSPVIAGLASIQLGKSAGYDFLLYHYYNGYAWLGGRLAFDIFPTSFQTYLNPALDAVLYVMIQHLPARMVGFVLGAIHGLNFVLAAAIAARIFPPGPSPVSRLLPVTLAAVGALGAVNLGLLGSFHHDNVVSLFFLASLLILVGPLQQLLPDGRRRLLWLALAGASVGAGTGLKFTLAPYALGVMVGTLMLPGAPLRRLAGLAVCGTAAAAAFLLTDGFQMLRLYRVFGNPVFPFLARFSAPPYDRFFAGHSFTDPKFLPDGLLGMFVHPFWIALNPVRVTELAARDLRIPLAYAAALLFAGVLAARWMRRRTGDPSPAWRIAPPAAMLLAVIAIAYLAETLAAGQYRYTLVVELLSFIILGILLFDVLGRGAALIALAVLAAVVIPTTHRYEARRQAWDHAPFVQTTLPPQVPIEKNAVALLVGANTGTYFIPDIDPSVRFLGVDVANIWPAHTGEGPGSPAPQAWLAPFPAIMHGIVDRQAGQLLLIYLDNDHRRVPPILAAYHLHSSPEGCGVIQSNIAALPPLRLCVLSRD